MANNDKEVMQGKAQPGEKPDIAAIHAAIMRENTEPADGHEPVPMLWLACVIAMALWAGSYFGAYNMGFSAGVLEGDAIAGASAVQMAPEPVNPMVAGKRVFNQCQACHQATGVGVPGQFPPLDESEWVLGDTKTLIRILLGGLEGDVMVRGKKYNNVMPAWGRLSDAQIAHVLTYIRGSWANKATAIDPEEVATVRQATASRKQAWSAQDLMAAAKSTAP
jgi:mono/diheme cytochrome c family protein